LVDVVTPETVSFLYDTETTYGDGGYKSGCGGFNPSFKWIGIIEDITLPYDNALRECRGIGSIDLRALTAGMKNPEANLKWIIQRKRTVATAFNPLTFLNYSVSFPTGIALGYEATYGSSYLNLWFKGMMMNSLDVEFSIDDFQRASAKLVGQDVEVAEALITADGRESNPLDQENGYALPLTGMDAEVFLNEAGQSDDPLGNVKNVHFFVKNNLVRIPVVRTANENLLKYILKSKRELGGELTLYIETKAELDFLTDSTLLDIRIDLQKTDNTPYFDFTNAKLDTGSLGTRLTEVPCEITLPFKATGISTG
jgi:hypothetical protein